jgi:dephospho-CoA kinase
VDNSVRKPVIGILGGIGSGKSAVAAEFAKLGCAVIDADKIAHELLDEPGVKKEVICSFSQAILDHTGKINRKKLADAVFADGDKLLTLNRILHPLVLAHVERLIERYNRQQQVKAIVLDMPLLVEVGWDKHCDRLIFVNCDREKRLERARKMGLFDENQLKVRENFQISLDKKATIADNTVDNNSGFSALARQVADIFSYIIGRK